MQGRIRVDSRNLTLVVTRVGAARRRHNAMQAEEIDGAGIVARIVLPTYFHTSEDHTMADGEILSKKIAEQFIADPEAVDLTEYTVLDEDAAVVLCRHNGDLDLDGLTEISSNVASVLARFEGGSLSLGGLQELSTEVAEILKSALPSLLLYEGEFSPEVQGVLRSHPSFRIDDSRLQNWLLEQCGFDSDSEGPLCANDR